MYARIAALAMLGAALPAAAETPSANTEATQKMIQALEAKLAEQGFTETKILPGSFVIHARTKDGEPVTMIISPNGTMVMKDQAPGQGQEQAQVQDDSADDQMKWY